MSYEQLLALFKSVYPMGCIYMVPGLSRAYDVQFTYGGKVYRYNASSRIALGRRLGLDVSSYERDYSSQSYDENTPDTIAGLPASEWGY